MERTAVYRLFGETTDLLYVGKSIHPPQRWREHAASKPWWHEVHAKTVEWFDSDEGASKAEASAIQDEKPRYNVFGTPRHREVSGARQVSADPALLAQVQGIMADLASIEDPVERFAAGGRTMELVRHTFIPGAADIRREVVQELHSQGLSFAEIGKRLGMDRVRVHQISKGRTDDKRKSKADEED